MTLVAAATAAFATSACTSGGNICQSAEEHARACLDAYCADRSGDEMCDAVRAGGAAGFAAECTNSLAAEAEDVLDQSCGEIVSQAIAAGKADVPCPWYFSWCGSVVPEDAGYSVHLLEADANHLTIQLDLERITRQPVSIDGRLYEEILVDGATTTARPGQPALPTIGLLVGIPWDTLAVEVGAPVATSSVLWDGVRPTPYRPLALDIEAPAPYSIDDAAYSDYTPYPETRASVAPPGVWRDYRVARLELNPFQVVTALDQVTVATSLVVEVRFIRPGSTDDTPTNPGTGSDTDDAYESGLVNFDTTPPRDGATDAPQLDYLVIVADELYDSLLPLLDYKEAAGLDLLVIKTSQIEGSDAAAIKAVIADVYAQRRPHYLLLVGATDTIPQFHYAGSSYWSSATPSDAYYSFLEGDDYLADVALGRLFARTPAELDIVVSKTLAYQRGDRRAPWRKKFVTVAHKENAPDKYTACVKSIVDRDYGRTVEWESLLGSEGGSNERLTAAINEGVGIVSYRGHGDVGQWEEWGEGGIYKLADHDITNGEMTPVIFSIACLTSKIEKEGSLAEQFMLHAGGGAVAFLGASEPSYTKPNHDFNRYLFSAILDRNVHRIGALQMQANAALLRQYGDDDSAMDNVKMYFWLGDPAIEVGVPYHCDGIGADAGPDVTILAGESAEIGAAASFGKRYSWTPVEGLSCSDCAQPVATPTATTTYVVAAENDCSRIEDSVTITVAEPPPPDAGVEPDGGPTQPDAGVGAADAGVEDPDAAPVEYDAGSGEVDAGV